jgi:hypothetical protein
LKKISYSQIEFKAFVVEKKDLWVKWWVYPKGDLLIKVHYLSNYKDALSSIGKGVTQNIHT